MARRSLICSIVISLTMVPLFTPASAEMKFKGGPYLRIKNDYMRNPTDLADRTSDATNSDNSNAFRTKTSLWGEADFNENVYLYAKLSNENAAYTHFGGTAAAFPDKQPSKKGYHYNINEVFFENLFLDVKEFLGAPLDLRIGRQDFIFDYGEGFLIMEGNTQDGLRSYYFNAAKASLRVDDKNSVDFIYINDPRTDQFLPVINRHKLVDYRTGYKVNANYLTTTDEQGYVLYWKNRAIRDLCLEGYYIFKRESEEGGVGPYSSEKTKLSTVGSFARYGFTPYTLRAQVAGQWGKYGKEDRRGLGGYIYLDREMKEIKKWSPTLTAGWIYLSGDDRKTNKQEGWDPLFSQWAWLSELYIFSLAPETGIIAYWTNLHALRAMATLRPSEKSKVTLGYLYLRAVESVPAGGAFSGRSKDRGHCPQFTFEYNFNKNVNLLFLTEYFIPGGFYANDDPALLVRTQMEFRF